KAKVRHLFKIQPKPYITMDFDRINLKELNFVQNRKAGDIVAVLDPPEPPLDGMNVCGERLPSQSTGADEILKAGENAKLNREKDKIISLIDGNVFIKNGAVHVERVVSVEDVNYKTGNIDFDGSIVVNGTIADGFTVKAKGSVQVARFVGKVAVEAGRDIVLRGGMNGNREGSLLCEGDLFSRYLESTTINCKGNLIVEEAIMHSHLTVGGNTLLTGKRAELLAGTSIIGGSLWCKKLGNVAEARTSVALGIEPENLTAYMKMQGMIEEKIEELDRLDSELRGFDSAVQAGKIPLERAFADRKELEDRVYQLNADISGLRSESRSLRKRMTPSVQSMLIVEQTMYHGVVINFGREEFRVPLKGLQRTIIRLNKRGKIVESGFNPLERPRVKFKYTREEAV
ncbi:MAG TPA: FapA family protein, partial [Spirochaetia bacterium]|nr:FapA family protein [Spirochaetia bacterium]